MVLFGFFKTAVPDTELDKVIKYATFEKDLTLKAVVKFYEKSNNLVDSSDPEVCPLKHVLYFKDNTKKLNEVRESAYIQLQFKLNGLFRLMELLISKERHLDESQKCELNKPKPISEHIEYIEVECKENKKTFNSPGLSRSADVTHSPLFGGARFSSVAQTGRSFTV